MTFSRYDRKGSVQSVYCYQDTDILINRLDIRDAELLSEADTEYSAQRLLELDMQPINGKFTLNHLKNIHKYIFQDIYYFAGKLRTEDISKGNTMFARSQFVKSYASNILVELENENYLIGIPPEEFSLRTAYYMSELNIIHPFREGNGRAIREFIRCLSAKCGYTINWNRVDKKVILQASILSVTDPSELAKCIEACIEYE